jgi:hypothetical protein
VADDVAALERLWGLPAVQLPPHTPTEELEAAAKVLRARDDWPSAQLALWLQDTAMIHAPLDGQCERDGDQWPCLDVQAAQKVAFTIGYTA